MSRQFGLFAKRPRAGDVKTRLAAGFGETAAAEIYTAFLHDLVERFQSTGDRRVLGYAPGDDSTRSYFKDLCGDRYDLRPQPAAGLGERMADYFDAGIAEVADRVVLIGSDSPTLRTSYVEHAFVALGHRDCVIGPATDGGYCLIGFAKPPPETVFQDIDWSGERVLTQTVERLATAGLSLHLLPMGYDVDTPADLQMLYGHLAAMRLAGEPGIAPRTWKVVEKHIANPKSTV